METWQTLLAGEWEDVDDEYGPESQAVTSAIQTLADVPWLKSVGVECAGNVVAVGSWDDAIELLVDSAAYGPNGHLLTPSQRCIEIIESDTYRSWWQQARSDAAEYLGISACIDRSWPRDRQDFVYEYIYEFVSFLLAEVIGSASVGSTYFREMLEQFQAGHFPAGWQGDWPVGRMRVY